ncbi:ureidoglycolate lyase [Salinisphaera sp. T31B1]|uniref:ureidoglycolate lyase n=1 Tax=Salinisphaera sp. T31B1 TaxID=727963 RepID=UPI00333F78AD
MADPLILQARPLTAAAFAPYGDVLETQGHSSEAMNQGWAERFRDIADIDVADQNGRVSISWVHSRADTAPVGLRLLERHPLGSQIFMPLNGHRFLVVVGPSGELPGRERLEAFVSNGRQGVNYRKGVWHHPMIALDAASDFIVIDRGGPGHNCDERSIPGGEVEVRL